MLEDPVIFSERLLKKHDKILEVLFAIELDFSVNDSREVLLPLLADDRFEYVPLHNPHAFTPYGLKNVNLISFVWQQVADYHGDVIIFGVGANPERLGNQPIGGKQQNISSLRLFNEILLFNLIHHVNRANIPTDHRQFVPTMALTVV